MSFCSAGIGRTGTIIVIDMIVDMISTKGEVISPSLVWFHASTAPSTTPDFIDLPFRLKAKYPWLKADGEDSRYPLLS